MTEESSLKEEAKQILTLAGCYHFPIAAGTFSAKGLPDRCAIRNGVVYMFEFKSKKGKQSNHQREFEETWKYHGGNYYLISTIEQLMDIFDLHERR